MKILLCAIGRLENQYVKEWVDYYKELGIDNICLYDNNRDGEDDFHDVINNDIQSGFVILKNVRNRPPPIQMQVYESCYQEYKNQYDWLMFFDVDEFLTIVNGKTLKEYLQDKKFEKYNVIHTNWMVYGDCGLIENDGRPVLERFTKPLDIHYKLKTGLEENLHIKSIVRGKLTNCRFPNPHTALVEGQCCSFSANPCNIFSPFNIMDYKNGFIRHYTTKTVSEFTKKIRRGFCDSNRDLSFLVELFFQRNERTKEKENIFRKHGLLK